ncbi:hypothetical protein ACJJTC_001710 [Scirpophaga incertulas]
MILTLLLTSLYVGVLSDHHGRTNQLPDRSTIVHLFEWKWKDIADECERFLAPKGYGGVQISPPSENLIIHLPNGSRPWYERYQVMSYKLKTRSGDENDFLNMTTRCNRVGVRIYADVVVNHMTGDNSNNKGTAGSTADFQNYHYPAVPYIREHFHNPPCVINNYNNVRNCQLLGLKDLNQTIRYVRSKICLYINHLIKFGVRSCNLVGLKDLNHTSSYVQTQIAVFLNNLISLGVAGFRVDAAKHMWPNDLKEIYKKLKNLNTEFGFAPHTKPFIYQEVIYYGNEPIKPNEYMSFGDVTEFRVGIELKTVFRGRNSLKWLVSWGEQWGLSPSDTALAFIDNHDTQRTSDVLTYKESRAYKAAIAFMLAHPYGEPRIMSSYAFENSEQGPPTDNKEDILSPTINEDDTCGSGWVCEHRWRQIYQMVAFRNIVKGSAIENWWDNGDNQIAFSRGKKGFIVFNVQASDLSRELKTGLPPGKYCDVISGKREGSRCSGQQILVKSDSSAHIQLSGSGEDMHLAIHVGAESLLQAA